MFGMARGLGLIMDPRLSPDGLFASQHHVFLSNFFKAVSAVPQTSRYRGGLGFSMLA